LEERFVTVGMDPLGRVEAPPISLDTKEGLL
jgi:hypothetical protein